MASSVYTDNPGMRGLGASGAYGTMSEDMYLRKIEQTDMYEDPMQVENHIRSLLVDFSPDTPFLASDQIRSSDDRGGGFHSKRFLNLRHHGVAGDESDPYLPDGTFLDHEFTERDPRGSAVGPDMRKHYEQQLARAAFIKFYDDNDYSVPEQGITPEKMISNIKSGMYQFKDRYQNFDESMGAWHNGGTGLGRKDHRYTSDVAKYTMDGTIIDLADAEQGNRTDAVARLSADPNVSFRHSTPDHRFKISKYGAVRTSQFLHDNDWQNNRQSAYLDHNRSVEIDGQLVNKQLANLIIDLQGIRETKQAVAQGAEYGDSYNTQIRSKKLHPDDVYKIMQIVGTQTPTANELLDGQRVHRYGPVRNHNNRDVLEQVHINHKIIESMQLATRKLKERERKDLREQILYTAADQGIYNEASTRARVEKSVTNNRESMDNRYIEDAKVTKSYAGIRPSKTNRIHDKYDVTDYGHHSLNTKLRGGKRKGFSTNNTHQNEYEQDRNRLDFGVFDRAARADKHDHMGRNLHGMETNSDDFGEEVGDADLLNLY